MPAKHRRWLDEQSCLTPKWSNSRGEYDGQPLPRTPPDTTDDLALGHDQLLSKEHVLGNEFDTWANKVGQQSRHEPKKVAHLSSLPWLLWDGICSQHGHRLVIVAGLNLADPDSARVQRGDACADRYVMYCA